MSTAYTSLPFSRGETLFGGTPTDTSYVSPVCGQEYCVRDEWFGTGRLIKLRAVRNEADFTGSGSVLLPKRRVKLSANGNAAVGYTRLPSETGYPVDHLIPSGGVAYKDVFFVVIDGPATVLSDLANYSADIAAGDLLNGQTAATSGSSTSGRVKLRTVAAATADATAGQRNVTEGDGANMRAISACLTNSTNADILVDVFRGRAV